MKEKEMFLLKEIIDSTDAVIYIKDLEGKYLMINSKYRKLFKLENTNVKGKTDYDIFPSKIAEAFTKNDKEVIKEKKSITVEEVANFEGKDTFYISNKFPLKNQEGDIIGVCGVSTDITEKIEMEKLIKRKEYQFSNLAQNLNGVVYRCATTSDWKMFYMNDYILELSGYPPSEFIDNNMRTFSSIIHPDDVKYVEEKVYSAINEDQTYEMYYRIVHKDGSIKWVHEHGNLFGRDNAERYLYGVIMDITKQKNLEESLERKNIELLEEIETRKKYERELERINKNLEKLVEERTIRLRDANENLKHTIEDLRITQNQLIESKKMSALGSMVAGISHIINTPLGISLTTATFINEQMHHIYDDTKDKNLTKEKFLNFLETTFENTELLTKSLKRCSTIINQFKVIAEPEDLQGVHEFKVKEYIETMLAGVRDEISKDDIKLEILCGEEITFKTSPGFFYPILINLITNSKEHAFKQKNSGNIRIEICESKEILYIKYSDDGDGMKEEVKENIFNPFFTTNMADFSGLGLFLVYNLVSGKLGGTIDCISKLGEGTSFLIKIPKDF